MNDFARREISMQTNIRKAALAIDIGASSGRHIAGWFENGSLHTEEIYRFTNGVHEKDGHLIWDIENLFFEVTQGMKLALEKYPAIATFSIDTWAVDYVLMRGEEPVLPCYAYRDDRTQDVISDVHQTIPFETLYAHTGIQFQPFNTVYQLAADMKAGRLNDVSDFLMIPEYLLYRLTGIKAKEYTNATSTGLVSAVTGEFDRELIDELGLPAHLFPNLSQPGTFLGPLLPEVSAEIGGNIDAVLCATHDTGSAVEGIPLKDDAAFLSSGTWSLLGVRLPKPITTEASRKANLTNEGGVGYVRYLKNIIGMWPVNRLREELCPDMPFGEIVKAAEKDQFDGLVDMNDSTFLAPVSMKAAFDEKLSVLPSTASGYFRCAYRSLALAYRDAISEIEENTGNAISELVIVGGGAKNQFLNRLIEEAIQRKVVPLPIEATAIGNLKIQLEGSK